MPTFSDFFRENLKFFLIGGLIIAAGLTGVILFLRQQGGGKNP